jgi:hypothetical protein
VVERQQHDRPHGQPVPGAGGHRGAREREDAQRELGSGLHQAAHLLDAGRHHRQVEAGGELARPAHEEQRPGLLLGPVERLVDGVDAGVAVDVGLPVVVGEDGDGAVESVVEEVGHRGQLRAPTTRSRSAKQ